MARLFLLHVFICLLPVVMSSKAVSLSGKSDSFLSRAVMIHFAVANAWNLVHQTWSLILPTEEGVKDTLAIHHLTTMCVVIFICFVGSYNQYHNTVVSVCTV